MSAGGTRSGGSPRESVEAFALLRARLSDPFADRAAVLSEQGLDERACAAIEAEWSGRLAEGGPAALALAEAFGEVYSRALVSGAGRREEARPPLAEAFEAAAPAPPVAAPAAPPPAVVAEAAPAPAPKPLAVPSFLKEPPAPPSAAPSMAVAAAPPPAPPAAAPAPQAAGGYTGTAEVDIAAIFAKKSVPFDPSARPAVPAQPATPAAGASTGGPKSDLSGETTDIDIAAIARRVLSFGPAGAAQPALTLDHYALLSAEIALVGTDPARRSAVFARFGVKNPEALMAEWRARLAADPAMGGRWSAAYAQHYARLRTERAAGR